MGIPFLLLVGSSCPCHSLQERARDFGRGVSLGKYLTGVTLFPISIPYLKSSPHSRLPVSPGQPLTPTLHVTLPPTQPPPSSSFWQQRQPGRVRGGEGRGKDDQGARERCGSQVGSATSYQVTLGKSLSFSCLIYEVGSIIPLSQGS